MTNNIKQPLFTPISRAPISEVVIDEISGMIRTGTLKPGDQLPSERELSRQFNVGRSSVREALRVLSALRLVVVEKGKGTFIADPEATTRKSFNELVAIPSDHSIEEILHVRFAIECKAAELASLKASEADIEKMEENLEKLRSATVAGDMIEVAIFDTAFHNAILRAAQNRLLSQIYSFILESMVRYRPTGWESFTEEERMNHVDDHEALFDAIRQGDSVSAVRVTAEVLLIFSHQLSLSGFDQILDNLSK